jgi:nucleotide-binding universal stress UspA family protein
MEGGSVAMYKKILAAFDGSDGSKTALERAIRVAQEYAARLTMAWVRGPLPHYATSIGEVEDEKEAADEYFNRLKAHAEQACAAKNISLETAYLRGNAAREIVHYAESKGFDLIVIGQVGHSDLIGRILGPTADRISETAHCDVLIVRRPDRNQ